MIVPLFATAAATSAICSGVTSSLSWPNAMRPGSSSRGLSYSLCCAKLNGPLAATSFGGSSIGGFE